MEIIRKQLTPLDLFPPDTRYDEGTDTVQTWDGENWVDTPERDPRNIDAYAPPDDRCNGAARMSAFLQDTVQGIIDGVDDEKSDAEIALVVLGVLALIPFVDLLYVLIAALVGALIIAGSSFLHSAFDDFVWDDLTEVIYCLLNPEGFITDAGLAALVAAITATFDTDPASILNDILGIVGRGGLNDAAALRTETGDCDGYDECTWTHDILPGDPLVTAVLSGAIFTCGYIGRNNSVPLNVQNMGGTDCWYWSVVNARRSVQLQFQVDVPAATVVTLVSVYFRNLGGGNLDTVLKHVEARTAGGCAEAAAFQTNPLNLTISVSDAVLLCIAYLDENAATKDFCIDYVRLTGTGVNPFLAEQ